MARGTQDIATQAANTAQGMTDQYGANAQGLFSSLSPTLQAEAAHPAGMSSADLAAADTAAQQSAGGSQGAAVGSGALRAARTRNAGGADAALGSSARSASQTLGSEAVGTRLKNASLKQQQQQEGLKGMEGLYGQNVTGADQALSQIAPAAKTASDISYGWMRNIFEPIFQFGGGSAPGSP
jgi:hypothetical protein